MTKIKKRKYSKGNFFKYPKNLEVKLEFDKILSRVEGKCLGPLGRKHVQRIRPITSREVLENRLQQVNEFKGILERQEVFPSENYIDLSTHIQMLQIDNSVLNSEQFVELYGFSFTAMGIFSFLTEKAAEYPILHKLIDDKPFDRQLLQIIRRVLNEDGSIKDNVYPKLAEIRSGIRKAEAELDRTFRQVLVTARNSGWLAEGEESIRNGRRVISLVAEHKRKIKGIIHDESSSGRVIYLEPEKIIEISNDIFELKLEERREIYKIFRELTTEVRPFAGMLQDYQDISGIIDFVRAKASFAVDIDANYFPVDDKPQVQLMKARHPLLYLLNKPLGKTTVPLDVQLDSNNHILVISGPNAGGKSVCMKTIGLLQFMLQCGMLLPAHPSSRGGIFQKIFADIGDEQSIENDLSTYTSHLQHMKFFMKGAGKDTLFMIDEFGTGTDPQLGGAMAEAILEDLTAKGAFGIITTHYSNLKIFADKTSGIINGSMIFDQQNLSPTYQMIMGKPGSSYAFEIAKNIGISQKTLQLAKQKAGTKTKNLDELLADLDQERLFLQQRDERIKDKETQLDSLLDTYRSLKAELEENRNQLLKENREKALQIVAETNRKMENLLKEIASHKQGKEVKQVARQQREKLQDEKQQLQKDIKAVKKKEKKVEEEIVEGAYVIISGSNQKGYVEQLRKNRAVVVFGDMRTVVDIAELKAVPGPEKQEGRSKSSGFDYHKSATEFKHELDLRGMRREEALALVESQIDKALLLNKPTLRIIHGRGNGVLRDAVRSMLKKYSQVKQVYEETADNGGDGITIAEFD